MVTRPVTDAKINNKFQFHKLFRNYFFTIFGQSSSKSIKAMFTHHLLSIFIAAISNLLSQPDSTCRAPQTNQDITISLGEIHFTDDPDMIYEAVEQMPQYPGGEDALLSFIQENIVYPTQDDVQGMVVAKCAVMHDGSVGRVEVVRSKHPDLDREAVRVAKLLKFYPGRHNGKIVNVWYNLPVRFRLQSPVKPN